MTVDEFLAWNDGTDTRYELAGGVLRAMAPPAGTHGTVAANATALIHAPLRSLRPCRPQAGAEVQISERTWWRADVAVTCRPPPPEVVEPLLIVEILSASTRTHDLGRKLDDYKTLTSVWEVWVVDGERRWVQVWWRGEDGAWAGRDHVGGGAGFAGRVLGQAVGLDELHADSGH